MFVLMLQTVVRGTAKGFFVGNFDEVIEVDDDLGAALMAEGKAAEALLDADDLAAIEAVAGEPGEAELGNDGEPAAEPAEPAIAGEPNEPAPAKNKGGRPRKVQPAAAPAPAETAPAPVAGDEAPAA